MMPKSLADLIPFYKRFYGMGDFCPQRYARYFLILGIASQKNSQSSIS